jgi:hypothetical protein
MNRLSPLIVRQPRQAARPLFQWDGEREQPTSRRYDDLKLFAVGWIGGLIFFGTLIS